MTVRDETGAGTVVAVMCVAVLLVLTVAGLQLGSAASTAHRARSGADLTALAAASAVQQGRADPCALSAQIARRNGTRLVACSVGPDDSVLVRVVARLSLAWPGLPDVVEARARAGPGSGPPAQVRGL